MRNFFAFIAFLSCIAQLFGACVVVKSAQCYFDQVASPYWKSLLFSGVLFVLSGSLVTWSAIQTIGKIDGRNDKKGTL